jgi:hypothetical protein
MSTHIEEMELATQPAPISSRRAQGAYQAYWLLYLAFVVAPIVAGFDKFFDFLVDWDRYLSPAIAGMLALAPHTFMQAVGVVEIVAGLLVAWRPAVGGYVVTLWLWGIILNLLLGHGYYDIALRDFGLSLGALALARLGTVFPRLTHSL